jgi:hypothetical protein
VRERNRFDLLDIVISKESDLERRARSNGSGCLDSDEASVGSEEGERGQKC